MIPGAGLPEPDWSTRPIKTPLQITAPAGAWIAIHGYLCLALRHPGATGSSRDLAEDAVTQIGGALVDAGVLTPEELEAAERVEVDAQPCCEVCGCTEDQACPDGCSWSDLYAADGRAICSRCVYKAQPTKPRILTEADPDYRATLAAMRTR